MKVGICKDCSYWVETPHKEDRDGECHHHSPGVRADPVRACVAMFPPIGSINWCGDFHFKKDEDE